MNLPVLSVRNSSFEYGRGLVTLSQITNNLSNLQC